MLARVRSRAVQIKNWTSARKLDSYSLFDLAFRHHLLNNVDAIFLLEKGNTENIFAKNGILGIPVALISFLPTSNPTLLGPRPKISFHAPTSFDTYSLKSLLSGTRLVYLWSLSDSSLFAFALHRNGHVIHISSACTMVQHFRWETWYIHLLKILSIKEAACCPRCPYRSV